MQVKQSILTAARLVGLLAVIGCSESPAVSQDSNTSDSNSSESKSSRSEQTTVAHSDAGASFDQCAAVAVEANEIPVNMLFILDSSGSMNCIPPDGDEEEALLCKTDPRKRGDGPSKWEVTYASLTAALEPLVGRSQINVAISSFPDSATRCDVEATSSVTFAPLNDALLKSAEAQLEQVTPSGETPIAGATILGYAAVAEALRDKAIRGNTFLVLLTDGQETCKPSEITKLVEHDAPRALTSFGIRTFAIGAPGSDDARLFLSQLAHAGGTDAYSGCNHKNDKKLPDCHLDMTQSLDFQADLSRVLDEITRTKALTCEFEVPQSPDGDAVDLNKVNVTLVETTDAGVSRVPIGRHEGTVGSCDDKQDGWTYSSDRKHILVCGSDCETVKSSSESQVQIVLGCRTLGRDEVR
jgi:hypothetical protein